MIEQPSRGRDDDVDAGPERVFLRPNPDSYAPTLFRNKAESYRRRWPWLSIVETSPQAF